MKVLKVTYSCRLQGKNCTFKNLVLKKTQF